jgi:hypothetical protein
VRRCNFLLQLGFQFRGSRCQSQLPYRRLQVLRGTSERFALRLGEIGITGLRRGTCGQIRTVRQNGCGLFSLAEDDDGGRQLSGALQKSAKSFAHDCFGRPAPVERCIPLRDR